MWSSLAAMLKKLVGGFDWVYLVLLIGVIAAATLAHVRGLRLDAVRTDAALQIQAEQTSHSATRGHLVAAEHEIVRLQSMLELARNATSTVQDSLRDALQREAEAVSAAVARKLILDQIRTRVRTETERMEVVDDETRDAVAARLNRPL